MEIKMVPIWKSGQSCWFAPYQDRIRTWDLLLKHFLTCRPACTGVAKTSWLRAGNTATGIFLSRLESVLDRWLEFDISGKGCFTHCSKTREVGSLWKKKVPKLENKKNWGTKDRYEGVWVKVPSWKLPGNQPLATIFNKWLTTIYYFLVCGSGWRC